MSLVLYLLITLKPPNFPFTSSAVKMFSMGKINPYLPLFLASCLFFISHSQTTSNTSSQQRCLPDQSSALLQLRQEFVEKRLHSDDMYDLFDYNDYYNGSYPKMKSWKADSDCCSSWDGVICDARNGHVIGLDLSNSWLCGPLKSNSSLFRLRHLRKLNLALNNFSSFTTIPSEFGQLVRLTQLNLSNSFLHGRIPSEISWLSNLVSLDLSFNYFVGADFYFKFLKLRRNDLEAFVQNMTYLKELHLDDLDLPWSLPQSLANLSSLTSLSLSDCILLGEFPSDIFLLPKIQAIDVTGNDNLTGFLPNFRSGSSLKQLRLSSTNFSGELPESIGNLKSLSHLDLSGANFSGELPNSIGNLISLSHLDLSGSNFSGELPNSIGNLKSLSHLDLSETNFLGELPKSIGNLKSLSHLDLSGANISGELLNSIGNLKSLSHLDLSGTNFLGELPNSIGNLKSLNYLELDSSKFSGEIPSSIWNLSQLTSLSLFGSNFHGQLPSTLGNLAKLTSLDLGYNLFSGKVPSSLGNLTQLEELDLSYNKFEGRFPISLTNITKLTRIDISGNQYLNLSFNHLSSFEQPLKVLPWKSLVSLDLRSNMLQGSLPIPPLSTRYFFASNNNLTRKIPQMICKVNSLEVLDISNNQLIGQIPQCLGHFSNSLLVLNMRNNCFQGNLPKSFIQGCNLMTLDFSHNQIQGKISQSLVKCRMLEVLNLGNNNMNDSFPFWLESLPELRILVLRENRFHGPIWNLHTKNGFSNLHVIDLSHNNFSGRLPSEYFRTWNAMQIVPAKDKLQAEYMGSESNYYEYSMTVVNKGLEIFLVKILTIFIAIDLSNNRFEREIPNSVGNLKGLIVLNLSSNSFMGHVPSSLGNLTELESLDLSQNELSGKIPQQLISLTFLEYLNLSQNQLIGPIPQGGQFWTFENSSFEGNSGLCGSPLSKKCGNNETPTYKTRQESSIVEGFDWKVVVIGYACGLIIGIVIGYFYTSRRTVWFVRNFGVHIRS